MTDENKENKEQKDKAFYESDHYFDLGDATTDFQLANGAQETASALAKLAGKSLFNAGLLAGKASFFLGKEIINNAPDIAARMAEKNLKENSHRMSDEQIRKTTEYVENNKGKNLFNKSKEGE